MKKMICLIALLILIISCTNQQEHSLIDENPLLQEWDTPFQSPPFDEIKNEHFMPAFLEGMKAQKAEIDAIIKNAEEPTFKNTIEALEKSGEMLDRVSLVLFCLNNTNTNDELQNISKELEPLRAMHNDDINLNEKLFARVKQIYDKKENLGLTPEQNTLLENYYLVFVRSGANLNAEDKEMLRGINEELSNLCVKFSQNHLKQTNAIGLLIDKQEDLAGLPVDVVQAAAEMAKARGMEGKWVFTLQKPSFIPFLINSENATCARLFSKHISIAAITTTNLIIRI